MHLLIDYKSSEHLEKLYLSTIFTRKLLLEFQWTAKPTKSMGFDGLKRKTGIY